MSLQRLIHGQLTLDAKKPIFTAQGFLQCPADIARTGIQLYTRADGTLRREYRPPEEVFSKESLDSFKNAPVTFVPQSPNNHPAEPVTAENADKYTSGLVTGDVVQNGELVTTQLTIMHKDAIDAALAGTASGVSCGYRCDLDETPGVVPAGQRDAGKKFDAIQRNIRGNHVAQVHPSIARAGQDARLRLDANDNAVSEAAHPPEEGTAMKIKINGVETEVSDIAAQLIEKERSDAAAQLATVTKARTDAEAATTAAQAQLTEQKKLAETEKARADAATEKATKAEKDRTDAADPKRVQALVKARVELETKARSILGDDAKLEEKTDAEVVTMTVVKAAPELKLDGKSPDYIQARFDLEVEAAAKRDPLAAARAALAKKPEEGKRDDAEGEPNVVDARNEMVKRNRELPKAKK